MVYDSNSPVARRHLRGPTAVLVAMLTGVAPGRMCDAAAGPTLTGTYAFSVVGTALVAQGSAAPSLVPAAIFGSMIFQKDGTISGNAGLNIGSVTCFAEGPGSATVVGGDYTVLASGPTGSYSVGNLDVGSGPNTSQCATVQFTGVTGSQGGGGGVVFTADPSANTFDVNLQFGTGTTAQGGTISAFTASGHAVRMTRILPAFPGNGEP